MDSIKILDKFLWILYFVTTGSIFWILLIVLAPVLKYSEISFAEYFYFLFEPVCHQIPERSMLINSEPMAVCTRCFAIYSGVLIFLLFTIIRKKIIYLNPNIVIIFLVPTIIDFLLEKFGLYVNVPEIRILTGLLFGMSIIYLILYSIIDLKNEHSTKRKVIYGKSEIN
jgi:uncharacterized membrane protein